MEIIILAMLLSITGVPAALSMQDEPVLPYVIPKPKIEKFDTNHVCLSSKGEDIRVHVSETIDRQAKPIQDGLSLLSDRLDVLGATITTLRNTRGHDPVQLDKCSETELVELLQNEGLKADIDARRLAQAYFLRVHQSQKGNPFVTIQASSDLGIYYGLLTLCQLVTTDDTGRLVMPIATIADWPEIGLRLAKTSASINKLSMLRRFSEWMKVFKINMIGLQYHGGNSKAPETPFMTNIKSLCNDHRDGVLQTIVYFCPFRGGGKNIKGYDAQSFQKPGAYDLSQEADREKYAAFLTWIMAQGADGIEIDYNDWPGDPAGMEHVINLVHETLQDASPQAHILFCPPFVPPEEGEGEITYYGDASPQMRALLSKLPKKIWPLWTGPGGIVIRKLEENTAEKWAMDAGRKPFFWLNRVALEVNKSFSRPLEEMPGVRVFHGEYLPKNLNKLFEGIHFNAGLGPGYNNLKDSISTAALVYFASAADYIWNPHAWDAVASTRRATHFVDVMQPLLARRREKE